MSSFFGSVADVISSSINTVVDKTKDVSEMTSLKSKLSKQERIIQQNYIKIGKQYFEEHVDDVDADFSNELALIKDAKKEADALREKIAAIKE